VAGHGVIRWPAADDGRVRHTVLVVDDHAEFRISVRALLEADGFDVVGEAGTGAEAIDAVGILSPQVVLLDVRLPDVDGITVAEAVASVRTPPMVVLVSSRNAEAYGARLRHAPVRGFLSKADLSGASLRRLLG
jgi:DNA-binding NarL/FixJ family response regulator